MVFRKVNWIFQIEIDSLKVLRKGIIINLETILSIIDFEKIFGFEIKLELKTSTYMVILEMNLFDLNYFNLETGIIF